MKDLVVTFTHSNYCIINAGTEKFVREYSSLLEENNYFNLTFFPIAPRLKSNEPKFLGIIENSVFRGIYKYSDINNIIKSYLQKHGLVLKQICVQHLKNHDLDLIFETINYFKVPVIMFLHDYFFLCNQTRMIDSNGEQCGFNIPNKEKCDKCEWCTGGMEHSKKISSFMNEIKTYVFKIIAPSSFVEKVFLLNYPAYKDQIMIRPHQVFNGYRKFTPSKRKIRIAFVGAQIADKGYEEWKKVITSLNSKNYEFYYFGFGDKKEENVKSIYVAGDRKGSMPEYLENNNIDCALFWSHCGETYSYVYYELLMAGVYVLTNEISGNVTEQVKINKNGRIFKRIEDCIGWLLDYAYAKNEIDKYKLAPQFAPEKISVNREIVIDRDFEGFYFRSKKSINVKNAIIPTWLYRTKHFFSHKGENRL